MDTEILFKEINGKNGDIGQVTLNRSKALNALTEDMIIALDTQLSAWDKAHNIKAVIIRAVDERAFCAGGDIRRIYEAGKNHDPSIMQFFWHEYRLNRRIFHYKKPYIALLDGITMGGGAGISIHGSHRIGTERLTFAMPETGIGFFPDIGGSYFLSRCPGKVGFYLGLTGAKIKVGDAIYAGLIDHSVPSIRLDELVATIANLDFTGNAHAAVTEAIEHYATPIPSENLATHRDVIDRCFSEPTVSDIIKKLQVMPNEWALETVTSLLQKSPTSLVLTLRELDQGVNLDFDHCMQMEYRMVKRVLHHHDLVEGVRAAIIDKDQQPKWQPESLAKVNVADIAKYFAPLGEHEQLKFAE